MNIPKWLKCYVDDDGLKKIEMTVLKSESATSAEIVPVIVRQSFAEFLPRILVIIIVAALFDVLFNFLGPYLIPKMSGVASALVELSVVILGLGIGYYFSTCRSLLRLIIPTADLDVQCNRRALVEFYQLGLTGTKQRTGILLFVSLYDHRAVVLADEAIAGKIPQATWDHTIQLLLDGLRQRNMVKGFCDAIEYTGTLLKSEFPVHTQDKNELRNHLIIKD